MPVQLFFPFTSVVEEFLLSFRWDLVYKDFLSTSKAEGVGVNAFLSKLLTSIVQTFTGRRLTQFMINGGFGFESFFMRNTD
mgnify:CR=1 FL=1